jgi:hypothetical protein
VKILQPKIKVLMLIKDFCTKFEGSHINLVDTSIVFKSIRCTDTATAIAKNELSDVSRVYTIMLS